MLNSFQYINCYTFWICAPYIIDACVLVVVVQRFKYFTHAFRLQYTMNKLYHFIFYENFLYRCNLRHIGPIGIGHTGTHINIYISQNPTRIQYNQKVLVFFFLTYFNIFCLFRSPSPWILFLYQISSLNIFFSISQMIVDISDLEKWCYTSGETE